MSDTKQLLQRARRQFVAPEGVWDSLVRRRDRKRRNQRIAAGVVGIAVFVAAVWISTTGGPFDRIRTTVGTNPTVPPDPTRVGFIGLPPEGATPSAPESGQLVVHYSGPAPGNWVPGIGQYWVYADGRLISVREANIPEGANPSSTGFLEQRLTPKGAELMRSEVVRAAGLGDEQPLLRGDPIFWGGLQVFDGDRLVNVEAVRSRLRLVARIADPASWLPASAWEDREFRAYVPSRYAVCYGGSPADQAIESSRILTLLPAPAEDLLRTKDRSGREGLMMPGPGEGIIPASEYCHAVTTDEARAIDQALSDAGFQRSREASPYRLAYRFWAPAPIEKTVDIWFEPILPHGEWTCSPCG